MIWWILYAVVAAAFLVSSWRYERPRNMAEVVCITLASVFWPVAIAISLFIAILTRK